MLDSDIEVVERPGETSETPELEPEPESELEPEPEPEPKPEQLLEENESEKIQT